MDTRIPNWDAYFMGIAQAVSARSKDPVTKVGAVVVNKDNHIIGTGYNGMRPGVHETEELWTKVIKHQHVIHAEDNCLRHTTQAVTDCTLYTTLFPCKNCAKLIELAGIKRVVYLDGKYDNPETRQIFNQSSITLEQL